jgi:hypothetical protein
MLTDVQSREYSDLIQRLLPADHEEEIPNEIDTIRKRLSHAKRQDVRSDETCLLHRKLQSELAACSCSCSSHKATRRCVDRCHFGMGQDPSWGGQFISVCSCL